MSGATSVGPSFKQNKVPAASSSWVLLRPLPAVSVRLVSLQNKSEVQRVNKSLALISPILLLILISIIPPIFGVLTR